jgi:hypothetical protein
MSRKKRKRAGIRNKWFRLRKELWWVLQYYKGSSCLLRTRFQNREESRLGFRQVEQTQ